MISIRAIAFMTLAALLSLDSITAEAMDHLNRDELRLLTGTSVAVVYLSTDKSVQPYIPQPGSPNLGVALVGAAVADHQMSEYLSLVRPYQGLIDKLGLPQATQKGVEEGLASIPALQQVPWATTLPDPDDKFFMKKQALKTQAQVVIFIQPQFFMDSDIGSWYMITTIEIETLAANGKTYDHFDGSMLRAKVEVDDDRLPPPVTPPPVTPPPDMDDDQLRAQRLFADGGVGFMQVYGGLLQQLQQQLYYFFTGKDTPPPAPRATAP